MFTTALQKFVHWFAKRTYGVAKLLDKIEQIDERWWQTQCNKLRRVYKYSIGVIERNLNSKLLKSTEIRKNSINVIMQLRENTMINSYHKQIEQRHSRCAILYSKWKNGNWSVVEKFIKHTIQFHYNEKSSQHRLRRCSETA